MLNKHKFEDKPQLKMSSSTTVAVSNSFSKTTTTTTTGGYLKTTGYRYSFSGAPGTYTPTTNYRSAFHNQPIAAYRSFNTKASIEPKAMPEIQKKSSRSLMSLLFKGDKDKEDKAKDKEVANNKDEKKKKEKEISKKDKDQKAKNVKTNLLAPSVIDSKLISPPAKINNGYNIGNLPIILGDMDKKLVIKVTKTRKIYGIENDKVPTYLTNSRYKRGNVLLINNIAFERNKYRAGAQIDHDNISKLFKDMGFTVKDYKNKSKKQMEDIVVDYSRDRSLKTADINVTIIMSHGNGDRGNTYIETIDNNAIPIEWIVHQFNNFSCSYLTNKPKIFIFQCCRGEAFDTIQTDATPFQTPRNQADVLLAYATVPGYVSHRDPKLGTWYIQSICKIFMEHAHDTDVESLLKIVDENLAKTNSIHRQTSSYENRGFKRCYLNPI